MLKGHRFFRQVFSKRTFLQRTFDDSAGKKLMQLKVTRHTSREFASISKQFMEYILSMESINHGLTCLFPSA